MITELMIAAAALTEASSASTLTGPGYDFGNDEIVVEAGHRAQSWDLPDLDYDVPDSCLPLIETELPGFGTLSFGRDCKPAPADQSGWWPK
jgi:hypothetical protein